MHLVSIYGHKIYICLFHDLSLKNIVSKKSKLYSSKRILCIKVKAILPRLENISILKEV